VNVVNRTKASAVARIVGSRTLAASHSSTDTAAIDAASSDPRRIISRAPCILPDQRSSPVRNIAAAARGIACVRSPIKASPVAGGARPVQRAPSDRSTRAPAPPR
jgi:hypothetical protein